MADLHARLVAAVNARLTEAQVVISTSARLMVVLGRASGKSVLSRFLVTNGPEVVIRHCERDLRVLERHAPLTTSAGITCDHCESLCHSRSGLGCESPDAPWPCDEIRDLATAYGVEVDHA